MGIVLAEPLEEAREKAQKILEKGNWPKFYFTSNGYGGICKKTYLDPSKGRVVSNYWSFEETGHTDEAQKELKLLFEGQKVFPTPKPTRLIDRVLEIAGHKEDLVLDFFSGSATTAHSVMKANARKETDYHYILVQLPEPLDETVELIDKSINTVDELGMERIKRAAENLKENDPERDGDYGFKHFTLKELTQNTLDKIEDFDLNSVRAIADMGDTPTEFDKDTILTTWVNNDGYGLSRSPEEIDLAGYTGYYMKPESGNGGHVYLVDKGLTGEAIDSLICRYEDERFNPETIVLYGYNFTFKEMTELKQNLQRLDKNGVDVRVAMETRY